MNQYIPPTNPKTLEEYRDGFLVCYLGDDANHPHEYNNFYEGYIQGPGWYWLIGEMLSPGGPHKTAQDAWQDLNAYLAEK